MSRYVRLVHRGLSLAAVLFGLVTVIAGGRVLSGSDPGFDVFLPLLTFNIVMGFVYVTAGAMARRSVIRGRNAAAAIFALNLLVLGSIGYLSVVGNSVAAESVGAMTFRTAVWLGLFFGFTWVCRIETPDDNQHS